MKEERSPTERRAGSGLETSVKHPPLRVWGGNKKGHRRKPGNDRSKGDNAKERERKTSREVGAFCLGRSGKTRGDTIAPKKPQRIMY